MKLLKETTNLIVQKYGGSSVGTPEKIKNVAARIAQTRRHGHGVVVAVSAMGDTTDELLKLAGQVTPHSHEREMDVLLSAGERISMALLSMALRDLGQEAISFTGSQAGIITDESHTRARILEIKPMRVKEELERGRVVIVAGFQGVSRSKEITTLGRGGSDTTAVALAAALSAARCEVYTDVPGLFSADPRLVPEAVRYRELPLELVLEMAVKGAQVMHVRSIEIAREKRFPLYVGLAHRPSNPLKDTLDLETGTMLTPSTPLPKARLEEPKVMAVTSRRGLIALRFSAPESAAVLQDLSQGAVLVHHLDFDSEKGLLVFIDATESQGTLSRYRAQIAQESIATVSLVGYQLQQSARLAAEMLGVLSTVGIKAAGLTSTSQSVTIWLSDPDHALAVKRLHEHFITSGEAKS